VSKRNGHRKEPIPDLRPFGVVVGQEDDGSLFDIGRYGELEALGISAAGRANRARDELIRRATIVLTRLDRNTTLEGIKALGIRGLRQHGVEYVLDPVKDVFVIYEHWPDTGRGEPLFWVFLCLHVLQPGGESPVFRGPDDNPIAGVQLRVGGDPRLIGAIRDVNWHAPGNSIWNGDDDERAGDDPNVRGGDAGGGDDRDIAGDQQAPA
jgi:hypothetical protein